MYRSIFISAQRFTRETASVTPPNLSGHSTSHSTAGRLAGNAREVRPAEGLGRRTLLIDRQFTRDAPFRFLALL